MRQAAREALETSALVLSSAVLFFVFWHFNDWVFSSLKYQEGVNWVFLPAGFKVILVLTMGLPAALGIAMGSWLIDREMMQSGNMILALMNGLVSGFTPWLVMKWIHRRSSDDHAAPALTAQHLLKMVLLFAAASSLAHQLIWQLSGLRSLNIWVDVWPMFIGDALGALLMLYSFKFVLDRLRTNVAPPTR